MIIVKAATAVVLTVAVSGTAQAWTDQFKGMLESTKHQTTDVFKISHCGRVTKSDFSLKIREVWEGAKMRIVEPNPQLGVHHWRVVIKVGVKEMKQRSVTFTCHF